VGGLTEIFDLDQEEKPTVNTAEGTASEAPSSTVPP